MPRELSHFALQHLHQLWTELGVVDPSHHKSLHQPDHRTIVPVNLVWISKTGSEQVSDHSSSGFRLLLRDQAEVDLNDSHTKLCGEDVLWQGHQTGCQGVKDLVHLFIIIILKLRHNQQIIALSLL